MKIDVAHARDHGVTCINNNSKYFLKYPHVQIEQKCTDEKYIEMSPTQLSMYRRLMKGLSAYSAEQICGFSEESLTRISKDHHKASLILYNMKLNVFIKPYNDLIKAIFPKQFKSWISREQGELMMKGVNFRKYGITEKVICEAFIKAGLLPENFFDLKQL